MFLLGFVVSGFKLMASLSVLLFGWNAALGTRAEVSEGCSTSGRATPAA